MGPNSHTYNATAAQTHGAATGAERGRRVPLRWGAASSVFALLLVPRYAGRWCVGASVPWGGG
jgi:hypothetical protein